MTINIMSDSGCDLPQELIETYNINIIPIFVLEGEKEYLDKIDITPEKVFNDMKEGKVYKTAQITPEIFINHFREYAKKDEGVIYLSLSGGLSGTYGSALIAKGAVESEYPNADITVIDSKAVSGGQGFIVLEAAKMVKNNIEKEKIIERINKMTENIEHIFTIDDMEYLYRGGRISKAQNLIGGLLSIKPVLWVNDGILEPLEKVRGKNKVLKVIIDIIKKTKGDTDLKKQSIIISHANDIESALKLKDMMIEEFGIDEPLINTIGAVIGAHAGPGTVAVFFLKENI
ncbi:DegV family protein [Tissierella creatinophila]|uniref:DegV domain-containing protein n=1 Tax=Tissierella creatinophila DSM 6911 TaxID=1123403 RepID=A0A1U7M429_TISCR|nr:DegV family protein [Tissierella creatinophila]OLS02051.1 DegV domain-containing protein [Tissierella creatinophila DSM 6911]